jgi:3-deoxy-D-manno-octulosonate 8-phosphate phosphatase (KDO 8-P phosphatase)
MIKYLIIDIDGTLTDGGVYYDEHGNELKKFCTKDGSGMVMVRTAGIKPIVITGRESAATTRRMKELGVETFYQKVNDKFFWLKAWMLENDVKKDEIGYIGDDLNDLAPMKLCGFVACPADAIADVKEVADYVSTENGGHGVIRDVIRKMLVDEKMWNSLLEKTFGLGV